LPWLKGAVIANAVKQSRGFVITVAQLGEFTGLPRWLRLLAMTGVIVDLVRL